MQQQHISQAAVDEQSRLVHFLVVGQQRFAWVEVAFRLWRSQLDAATGSQPRRGDQSGTRAAPGAAPGRAAGLRAATAARAECTDGRDRVVGEQLCPRSGRAAAIGDTGVKIHNAPGPGSREARGADKRRQSHDMTNRLPDRTASCRVRTGWISTPACPYPFRDKSRNFLDLSLRAAILATASAFQPLS
jgi:hypothetical protein